MRARVQAGATAGGTAPGSEQASAAEVVVRFSVPYKCTFGEVMKVVGNAEELGAWDASAAPPLTWNSGDNWTGEVRLPPGTLEFKVRVPGAA